MKIPQKYGGMFNIYVGDFTEGYPGIPMFIAEAGEYPYTHTQDKCLISKILLIWLRISYATIQIQLFRSIVNILMLFSMSQQNTWVITSLMKISNR